MENTLKSLEILISFGLEERAARLYLALLEMGRASVLELSKKSGVERVAIYQILKDLRRRQLIREVYDEKNRLRLQPVAPRRLLEIERGRFRQIESALPELEALFQEVPEQPRIRIFKGVTGIDELYADLIETMRQLPPEKREILTYTPIDLLEALPVRNQKSFRQKRIKHQISIRVISNDTPEAREMATHDSEELRQTRFLPIETPALKTTLVVYANKVAQYNIWGEIYVPIIENADMAATQRSVFETAWRSLGGEPNQ